MNALGPPADPAQMTAPSDPAAYRHTKAFAARRDQVREARQFLAALLTGCPAAYDATLALSELATNAVIHSASRKQGGSFTVTADICEGSHVRIEVRDGGGPWITRENHDDRPHGLSIVASLSTEHGHSGDPSAGWTAWAVIDWREAPSFPATMNGAPR